MTTWCLMEQQQFLRRSQGGGAGRQRKPSRSRPTVIPRCAASSPGLPGAATRGEDPVCATGASE